MGTVWRTCSRCNRVRAVSDGRHVSWFHEASRETRDARQKRETGSRARRLPSTLRDVKLVSWPMCSEMAVSLLCERWSSSSVRQRNRLSGRRERSHCANWSTRSRVMQLRQSGRDRETRLRRTSSRRSTSMPSGTALPAATKIFISHERTACSLPVSKTAGAPRARSGGRDSTHRSLLRSGTGAALGMSVVPFSMKWMSRLLR
mmetsp:Transcript_18936/g.72969  ORF Transcript_18936/g.72969 Transcript_18936/m.72969 type:complete len:203 (-) Transcript_18936:172-780(-)